MGNAGSAPEQVYKAAKLNNQEQLNNLIREARRQNNNRLPHGFLEYTDDEGRTPLCVACSKNNNHVVETLLRSGANVHHMSRSSNSGSPLHAAVFHRSYYSIEPLLRHGASPFVMNVMGRTPYDMVQEYKLLDLLRLFEHYSLYAGWMMVECSRLGLTGYKPEWVLRWCVLIQRLPCPVNQQQQRVVRTQLCIYENQRAVEPLHFKPIWIDGSHIEVPQSTGGQHVLCLHPSHQRVRGRIYVRTAKTGVQKLGFKACDSTQSSIAYVQRFESKVNELFQRSRNQANVPQPPPPQTPTGGDPQRYPNIQADAAPQPGGPGGAPAASGPGTPAPIATPPAPIATPPPGAALPGETDEMMARRLQEEYNRELGIPPSAANRPGTASSYPQPAPDPVKPPRAPSAPMLSSEPGTSASSDAPPPPPLPHPAASLPVHAEEKPPEPSASAGKATTWNSEEMFICSITQEVMEDPVLADDGHSYERAAIESWFSTGRTTSPLTGRPMDKHLTPNHTLRNIIQAWKEQQQPQQ